MMLKRPRLLPAIVGAMLVLSFLAWHPAAAQPAADPRLDSLAKLLAGLPPTHPDHARLAGTAAWKEHSRALQASWARVRDGQRAELVAWRKAELPAGCPGGQTLFYPFSGADFLNAHWLFPDCAALVMFGLERIGEVPAVESMTEKEFAQMLAGLRNFMINLFVRNYFVTDTMAKGFREQRVPGLVPVFMVLMALSGAEVVRVSRADTAKLVAARPVAAYESGAPRGRRDLAGVTIEFRVAGAPRAQRLDYFALDATDAGLAGYPQFVDYLRGLAPTTTLIKSASYLLHGNQFTQMRDVILDVSRFLVQDDTGLPYARLLKRGWQARLYGVYGVPIPPFEYAYQKPLAAAYEIQKPQGLPFRFGYQMDSVHNRSTLMVARLPAAVAPGAERGAR